MSRQTRYYVIAGFSSIIPGSHFSRFKTYAALKNMQEIDDHGTNPSGCYDFFFCNFLRSANTLHVAM